ncbi:MAG: hypothetical protein NZM37_01685 [Sandaracinaceae bacterium]|nr:hypothetical protein [Sandaracinaceae bacterium]
MSTDIGWLLREAGLELPHDGQIDALDAIEAGLISEELFAELLAKAIHSVVIDLDKGALDPAALQCLPPSVARATLSIPVLLEEKQRTLQVAFANPLDRSSIDTVRQATGLEIRPLVAPLSAVRRAIEREYGAMEETTKRIEKCRTRTPLGNESADELGSSATYPLIRYQSSTTLEERLEALIDVLVTKGIFSQEEFFDALQRVRTEKR